MSRWWGDEIIHCSTAVESVIAKLSLKWNLVKWVLTNKIINWNYKTVAHNCNQGIEIFLCRVTCELTQSCDADLCGSVQTHSTASSLYSNTQYLLGCI